MTENKELPTIDMTQEVLEEDGVEKVKLKRPVDFEGQTYRSVKLRLENLTGADIEAAEVQFMASNPEIAATTPLKEMSKGFLSIVAAKAMGKPVEFVKKLSAPDYSRVTTKVQIFLMSGE
ncbi:phage tail assembly protein [Sporosarcina sp. P33]|uniref:phage tail assembly protein n=1 Tax=Sporosarcina sp. P33 TaxID=1930764 RepID=UPI0009C1BFAE|nr:phage tail assembly protein [Sporosarcina sp. P33]ARD47573.1 hypothetical protein SporoP33_04520 [Sporosarcina sp. P33]